MSDPDHVGALGEIPQRLHEAADAVHELEGGGWLAFALIAALILGGTIGGVFGALRRRTEFAVVGVFLLWAAVIIASVGLAQIGPAFLGLVRATQPAAVFMTGCIGLLLLVVHLSRLSLQRDEKISAVTGLALFAIGFALSNSSWADVNKITEIKSGLLWGSSAFACILGLLMFYHVIKKDYAKSAAEKVGRAPPFVYVVFPVFLLYGTVNGYMLVDNALHGSPCGPVHTLIAMSQQRIEKNRALIAEHDRYIQKDQREIEELKQRRSGIWADAIATVQGAVERHKKDKEELIHLIPHLELALWQAERLEEVHHRISADDAVFASELVTRMVKSLRNNEQVDRTLEDGTKELDRILRGGS